MNDMARSSSVSSSTGNHTAIQISCAAKRWCPSAELLVKGRRRDRVHAGIRCGLHLRTVTTRRNRPPDAGRKEGRPAWPRSSRVAGRVAARAPKGRNDRPNEPEAERQIVSVHLTEDEVARLDEIRSGEVSRSRSRRAVRNAGPQDTASTYDEAVGGPRSRPGAARWPPRSRSSGRRGPTRARLTRTASWRGCSVATGESGPLRPVLRTLGPRWSRSSARSRRDLSRRETLVLIRGGTARAPCWRRWGRGAAPEAGRRDRGGAASGTRRRSCSTSRAASRRPEIAPLVETTRCENCTTGLAEGDRDGPGSTAILDMAICDELDATPARPVRRAPHLDAEAAGRQDGHDRRRGPSSTHRWGSCATARRSCRAGAGRGADPRVRRRSRRCEWALPDGRSRRHRRGERRTGAVDHGDGLREQAASVHELVFARFHANVWTGGEAPW